MVGIGDFGQDETVPTEKLHKSKVMLKTYTDEPGMVGEVGTNCGGLFGRNWIRLDWATLFESNNRLICFDRTVPVLVSGRTW